MMPTRARFSIVTALGLVLALGWPWILPLWRTINGAPLHTSMTDLRADAIGIALSCAIALAILLLTVFCERLPLRSLGFRVPNLLDIAAAAGALIVTFVLLAVLSPWMPSSAKLAGDTPAQIASIPIALRIALFLTAGFCEELAFRGYVIERIAKLSGSLWLGALVSVVAFTVAHIPRYGMTLGLSQVLTIAIVLSALYVWRRNLWLCVAVHAAIDAVALLLGPLGHA